MNKRSPLIPALISAVMLFIAIPHLPYGYYQLLRWIICASGIYIAYLSYESKRTFFSWPMGIIALLFNPLVPFHLDKDTWVIIDFIAAPVFIVSIFVVKEQQNTKNPICYLCGKRVIGETPSGDHSIPQQFIKRSQTKVKGFDYGGKLPTHAKCNNQFGPEQMCFQAVQLLGAYQNLIYTNLKNPDISIPVKKEEIKSFTKKDLDFFGLIDTTNVGYENWAHNPGFFKDKKKIIPFKKPLNIALSVLTKSAAALLVKRFNVSPKSRWNILCMPFKLQKSTDDFDSIFGETKPFDIGIKIWIKKCENLKDFLVLYKNEKVLLIIVFTFSKDEKCKNDFIQRFNDADKFFFKSSCLMDLVTYNWINNIHKKS